MSVRHKLKKKKKKKITVKKQNKECQWNINFRLLTKGGGVVLRFFPGRSKTLKKVTKGIWVISFTSFAVIFMEKMGHHLTRGRVSRQSQRVGMDATFFSF